MDSDPILREVHRMKDELAREVGYDVKKLFERLREAAKEHPERMVSSIPKPGKRTQRKSAGAKR